MTGLLVLAASSLPLGAQQPNPRPTPMIGRRPTPMVGMQPTAKPEMLEIYQIDLVPSGSAFALNKPVLQNNSYVFKVWPEREIVHLRKERVRQITQRTKDLAQFRVYQIDLKPSGRMLAKESPQVKNGNYVFHTWLEGKLMSLRQVDVLRVQELVGLPAFKAQQEAKGASLIGNLPMEGGGSVTYFSEPPPPPPQALGDSTAPGQPSNWNYDGVPGATDAYAPANAVVERPGDPPKAPTPRN
ncbi:MAG TPA: hypothetical protein VGO79_08150 [Thermoanaerobaculia bacterium]